MENLQYEIGQRKSGQGGTLARVVAEIRQIFSDLTRRAALRAEFADLDRRGGLDVVLDDIGVTRAELAKIIAGYPVAGRLLPAMARRLGIDIGALDPHSRHELERGCATCQARRSCRSWLDKPNADRSAYRVFCANAQLFDTICKAAKPYVQAI